jgi:ferritin-like metal-binding protein YciE
MATFMENVRNFFAGDDANDREGLQALFVDELKGIYYTEKQLLGALQEQADTATTEEVRSAFIQHKQETQGQVQRLEQIFQHLGLDPDEGTCNALDGLVDDARTAIARTNDNSLTRDAALIIAGQKVEHHEIAAYGSLHTLAQVLGYSQSATLLEQSLEEEKATDRKLTQLAESFVNERAADESDQDDDRGTTSGGYVAPTYSNDPRLGGLTGV